MFIPYWAGESATGKPDGYMVCMTFETGSISPRGWREEAQHRYYDGRRFGRWKKRKRDPSR